MMQSPNRIKTLLMVFSLCCLTACGFQLKGVGGTTLPVTWQQWSLVSSNPNGELSREVKNVFANNGMSWVTAGEGQHSLHLSGEQFEQRSLSTSTRARVAEYQLTMSTVFSVRDAEGKVVIEDSKISTIEQLENDPFNPTGIDEELRLVKAEMRRDLANQILRRIGYVAADQSTAAQ